MTINGYKTYLCLALGLATPILSNKNQSAPMSKQIAESINLHHVLCQSDRRNDGKVNITWDAK